MATAISTLVIHASTYDSAIVEVIAETEKALNIRNVECGRSCWLPKSGLKQHKPGVATYENERVLAGWIIAKLSRIQMKCLNIME